MDFIESCYVLGHEPINKDTTLALYHQRLANGMKDE